MEDKALASGACTRWWPSSSTGAGIDPDVFIYCLFLASLTTASYIYVLDLIFLFLFWTIPERGGGLFLQFRIEVRPYFGPFWSLELYRDSILGLFGDQN